VGVHYKCDKNTNMEIETLKTNPTLSKKNRLRIASLLTFDLPTLIKKMKHDHNWEKGELNAMILLKSHDKQIVLTALHEGTEINSFQSDDSITFQIIEGKIQFHTRNESVTIAKGQLLTLHENIKYSLTTDEETVFLLTIANGTLQPA
jgi:quercetin dioxygenase-like cupin family protein